MPEAVPFDRVRLPSVNPVLVTTATVPVGVTVPLAALTVTVAVTEAPAATVVELSDSVVVVAVAAPLAGQAAADVLKVPLEEYHPFTPLDGAS